jgi:hypothetical protein
MRFAVFLLRQRGRVLPRDEFTNQPPRVGDLRIEELRDETLGRYVRMARVLVFERPRAPDVLAELFDPVIVAMSPQAFTLSGFERVGDQSFAQAWLVRAVEHSRHVGR